MCSADRCSLSPSPDFLSNIVAFLVLNGGNKENLNMRSAWLHVLGDMLGFFIAIVAAGIILFHRMVARSIRSCL